jgi:hypothetical protein
MRSGLLALLLILSSGCHRPTEVQGLYITLDGAGTFFPCDDPRIQMAVQDSALEARYHATNAEHTPVFVRLRGVKGHEGSIYGGQRSFFVQQILEVRPRVAADCPRVAPPLGSVLPRS